MQPGLYVLSDLLGGDKSLKMKGCGVQPGHTAMEGAEGDQTCRVTSGVSDAISVGQCPVLTPHFDTM